MFDCREWIIKITNIYFGFVCMVCQQWLLYPLVVNFFTANETKNDHYHLNILNFRFPITMDTYNQYYSIFYAIDSVVLVTIVFVILYSDMYVMSLSLIIISHYKVLNRAFENIGHDLDTQMDGKNL